ncbi:KilA-N domain-containing protein [Salmonella enterica]|nr:KilA-N domain-containing protein [Salmonella enterica]
MTTSQGASRDVRYYDLNYDQMIVVCKQTYDVSWYRSKSAQDLALQICSAKNISSAFKQMHKVVQHSPMAIQEINVKEITITFNGITTKLISDNEGMFNLNVLHKASGNFNGKRPSLWMTNSTTRSLLEAGNLASKSVRGRGITGTWIVEQGVYAYASWISPE